MMRYSAVICPFRRSFGQMLQWPSLQYILLFCLLLVLPYLIIKGNLIEWTQLMRFGRNYPNYQALKNTTSSTSHSQLYDDHEYRTSTKSVHISTQLNATDKIHAQTIVSTTTPSFEIIKRHKKNCSNPPPNLVGPIQVSMNVYSMEELVQKHKDINNGGHGYPLDCKALNRVGIVIPFRDRDDHLHILLNNLHSFLMRQLIDYVIIVVEPIANQTFNRAKLMNVGFVEGLKLYPFECFIFHDVDMIPENDKNLYTCPDMPRHMSVAIDKFNYSLPYYNYFGGISAFRVEHLRSMNGFSNDYYGWGGEDDDSYTRTLEAGYNITRYPEEIARYKMIKHNRDAKNPENPCRHKLLELTKSRYKTDGLNSLRYKLISLEKKPLYTRILVDLMEKEERKKLDDLLPTC